MTTARLYHGDSFLRAFTGVVVAHGEHAGRASVVLDRTAFYPEAGGQMADGGELGGRAVVDVQVADDGRVHHVIEGDGELPAVGAAVAGEIDWARRRLNMALHTGQHMLSRGLLDVGRAATVSARLGEACTIDVDRELAEREVADAEALVNAVIDDDVAIRAWFPEPGELAALPLRREPKVESDVRVIAIGDFDLSPCGGTHCARTAQVGSVRVLSAARHKGGTRVTFAAGRRARDLLAAQQDVLGRLARDFTCAPDGVPVAVDRLRRELQGSEEQRRAIQRRWAEALADGLLAGGSSRVVASIPDADVEVLRALATRVTAAGRDALLAAPSPAGTAVLLARAAGSALDCGALLRAVAQDAGGRGGGRPDHAEGRLPAGVDWVALVAARS